MMLREAILQSENSLEEEDAVINECLKDEDRVYLEKLELKNPDKLVTSTAKELMKRLVVQMEFCK